MQWLYWLHHNAGPNIKILIYLKFNYKGQRMEGAGDREPNKRLFHIPKFMLKPWLKSQRHCMHPVYTQTSQTPRLVAPSTTKQTATSRSSQSQSFPYPAALIYSQCRPNANNSGFPSPRFFFLIQILLALGLVNHLSDYLLSSLAAGSSGNLSQVLVTHLACTCIIS